MCAMRVTVTGATGLIGSSLVAALRERGAQVTVLTRDPDRARARLGDVEAVGWDTLGEPGAGGGAGGARRGHAPGGRAGRAALEREGQARDPREPGGRDAQPAGGSRAGAARARRCCSAPRRPATTGRTARSRSTRTPRRAATSWRRCASSGRPRRRPRASSACAPCSCAPVWCSTAAGGALAKMLPAFKLGVGGPVAGGFQYMSWIHAQDVVGMMLAALADERWSGPVNATAPEPVPNRVFSKALGRVLGRPSLLPVPGFALQRSVRRDGGDRHHRRPRDAGEGAGARLRVRPAAARAGAALGAQAAAGSARARGRRFSVSMITRHGRLLSR